MMNVRLATPADLSSILNVERACPTAAHWPEGQYRQSLQPGSGPSRLVLVAEPDTKGTSNPAFNKRSEPGACLLGFLAARMLGTEWELENIVVVPSEQRKGVGYGLMIELLRRAREMGGEVVFLEVRESNMAARSLYERAGFAQAGRRRAYYAEPSEDAILFRIGL